MRTIADDKANILVLALAPGLLALGSGLLDTTTLLSYPQFSRGYYLFCAVAIDQFSEHLRMIWMYEMG
jgi:hypothetical protein